MSIPIIIVHRGNQKYLHYSIDCATKSGNRVILLGDDSNKGLGEWYDIKQFSSDKYEEFKKSYVHMSSNPEKFELICFERFFRTLEFAIKYSFDRIIMMDSDICLYDTVDDIFTDVDFACSMPIQKHEWQWIASAHFSYWTVDALKKYIEYLIDMYKEHLDILEQKWNWHKKTGTPGGICDMTLLYQFCQTTELKKQNTLEIAGLALDNSLANLSINNKKYEKNPVFNIKMVENRCGQMFFSECNTGKKVPVLYIHAQGDTKKYMRSFAKMKCGAISLLTDNVIYWINRFYEKGMRIIGIEKRYGW